MLLLLGPAVLLRAGGLPWWAWILGGIAWDTGPRTSRIKENDLQIDLILMYMPFSSGIKLYIEFTPESNFPFHKK